MVNYAGHKPGHLRGTAVVQATRPQATDQELGQKTVYLLTRLVRLFYGLVTELELLTPNSFCLPELNISYRDT